MDKEHKLDKKTIEDLKKARARIEGSEVYTEQEAKVILNMLKKKRPRIKED